MRPPAAFTLEALAGFYAAGGSAVEVAREALSRIKAFNDPALFLATVPEEELLARAAALPPGPLHGVPFVVKDNIDAAGLPTTAACPDFSRMPEEDAPAVARLLAAGALLLGKVNLDQFATGLNGTRSPYGTPRNAVRADLIPGGSSSGSATAVAAGIAAFSYGTDTAGSGRVPAAAQNIVGLKPSLGLIPTRGVVPACRSLDCVSIFAQNVADAAAVLAIAAGPDAADPYGRAAPSSWRTMEAAPPVLRLAVPEQAQLLFDTPDDAALFAGAVARAEAMGAKVTRVDIAPFLAVARRLYDGAWVAERTSALRDWVTQRPDALHPVTRSILEGGLGRLTVDAFDDFHAAAEARLLARKLFATCDALLLPTCPGVPTLATLAAEPIAANSRLGTYTNFVNLCDLSALAIPAGFRADGVPAGVTLVGPAFSEGRLAAIGAAMHHAAGLGPMPPAPAEMAADEIGLFCIGAHMSGLPLNGQVLGFGGRFLRAARTAPTYRLYDLGNRPGMVRAASGGASILGEIWALPAASIGPFLAAIPPPLGFGRVTLEDGSTVLGFQAESEGVATAPEITARGGWRAHLAAK
ncbi:allophanate hydrolase [Roseococcus sp. SDR]|uniref:allophanate hydrolase n=1 Tax=Roseococcus sp. SDR TaxID=2835532 RepID=UPI001BD0ABA4|nr:allophanate hydrolase [Roseococcus sp. SDR]MBS7791083.1 allophanate hydrolase [Roseococcus sp. SDR]MBV1846397.1 allophanate hydrolase [Roseococcus sp. SDR]